MIVIALGLLEGFCHVLVTQLDMQDRPRKQKLYTHPVIKVKTCLIMKFFFYTFQPIKNFFCHFFNCLIRPISNLPCQDSLVDSVKGLGRCLRLF